MLFEFIDKVNTFIEQAGLETEMRAVYLNRPDRINTAQVKTLVTDKSGAAILLYLYGNSEDNAVKYLIKRRTVDKFEFKLLRSANNPYKYQLQVTTPTYTCLSLPRFLALHFWFENAKVDKYVLHKDFNKPDPQLTNELIAVHIDDKCFSYDTGIVELQAGQVEKVSEICDDVCKEKMNTDVDYVALNLFYNFLEKEV